MKTSNIKTFPQLTTAYETANRPEDYDRIVQELEKHPKNSFVINLIQQCKAAKHNLIETRKLTGRPSRKRKSSIVETTTAIKKEKISRKPKLISHSRWKIGDTLFLQDSHIESEHSPWNGSKIEDINYDKQFIKISGECWELSKFMKFEKVFKGPTGQSSGASSTLAATKLQEASSALPVTQTQGASSSNTQNMSSTPSPTSPTSTNQPKKVLYRYAASDRQADLLTSARCTSELIRSKNFNSYLDKLKGVEEWKEIVLNALKDYHLIEIDEELSRIKTHDERIEESQQSMHPNNIKVMLNALGFEFLCEQRIDAYGRTISLLDLLFQAENWDVLKTALPEGVTPPQESAWMHFTMSNVSGITNAIELSKRFPDHQWHIENTPPPLFYYLIENPSWHEIPDNFHQFLLLLINSKALNHQYSYNGAPRSLFIDLIQKVATSTSKNKLKIALIPVLTKLNQGDHLFDKWIDLLSKHPCDNEAYSFMVELLIKINAITKEKFHNLAIQHPKYNQLDDEHRKINALLSDLDAPTKALFLEHNQLDKEDKITLWVIDHKVSNPSGEYYSLVIKDVPKYTVTNQTQHMSGVITLKYKHNPAFFLSWVESLQAPLSFLNASPLSPQSMHIKLIRNNNYSDQWVPNFFNALGMPNNDKSIDMDKFRATDLTFRPMVGELGILADSIVKASTPKLTVTELKNSLQGITFRVCLNFNFYLDGEIKNRTRTVLTNIQDLHKMVIYTIHGNVKSEICKYFSNNHITIHPSQIQFVGNTIHLSELALDSQSGGSSSPKHTAFTKKFSHLNTLIKDKGLKVICDFNSTTGRAKITLFHLTIANKKRLTINNLSVSFTYDYTSDNTNNIDLFIEVIRKMVEYSFTARQILGHDSIPLHYTAFPPTHASSKWGMGFEWVEFKFEDDFKAGITGAQSITMSNLRSGLQDTPKGVDFTMGEKFPLSLAPLKEKLHRAVLFVCGHYFTEKAALNISGDNSSPSRINGRTFLSSGEIPEACRPCLICKRRVFPLINGKVSYKNYFGTITKDNLSPGTTANYNLLENETKVSQAIAESSSPDIIDLT
jgi:hypothetical protein